jgi:hypothetical protein
VLYGHDGRAPSSNRTRMIIRIVPSMEEYPLLVHGSDRKLDTNRESSFPARLR